MMQASEQVVEAGQQQLEDEKEEELSYLEVDALQEHGINVSDIKKLKDAGLFTIGAVVMKPSKV